MAKISYSSLKLKTNTEITKVDFNGSTIEILKYLPISDKYDLINATLEKSMELDTLYNPLKIDMYFHLHLVYMYTNITFTDKQREDELKLYDTLDSNGLLDLVLENIDDQEYEMLSTYIQEIIDQELTYKTTLVHFLNSFLQDMPKKIEAMREMASEINIEQLTSALDFAKSLNGGREI